MLIAVLGDTLNAQESYEFFPKKVGLFVHVPSLEDTGSWGSEFLLEGDQGIVQLSSEIGQLIVDKPESDVFQQFSGYLSDVVGKGTASLGVYIDGQNRHSWLLVADQDGDPDSLGEILSSIESDLESLFPGLSKLSLKSAKPLILERKADDFHCDVLGFKFVIRQIDGYRVFASSVDMIEKSQACRGDEKKSLLRDRSFIATLTQLNKDGRHCLASCFVNPRLIQEVISVGDVFTLDRLLPRFYEKIPSGIDDNEIVGIGVRAFLISPKNNKIGEVIAIDGLVRSTIPRLGVMAAVDGARVEDALPVDIDERELDFCQLSSMDFSKVFHEFGKYYDKVQDGDDAWKNKISEVESLHKCSFKFRELYESLDGISVSVGYRKSGKYESASMLKFKSDEEALKLARMIVGSGFMNQEFPFQERSVEDAAVFIRNRDTLQAMKDRMGRAPNKRVAYTVLGSWFIQCGPGAAKEIVEGYDEGKEENRGNFLDDVLSAVEKHCPAEDTPFFLEYRSPYRWAGGLTRLKRLLNFEKKYRGRAGFSHPEAPTNLRERISMTIQFRVLQTFVAKLGRSVFSVANETNGVRFFFLACRPKEEKWYGGSLTSLSEYIKPKNELDNQTPSVENSK
jgi:hypothetical protein